METYQPFFTIRILHNYYPQQKCRCFELRPEPETRRLMKNRNLLFRQQDTNEWQLLCSCPSQGVHDNQDQLHFQLILNESRFLYFTKWESYDPAATYRLNLSGQNSFTEATRKMEATNERKKPGIFCTLDILLDCKLLKRAQSGTPRIKNIHFQANSFYWEYFFIFRQASSGRLLLDEAGGEITFAPLYTDKLPFVDTPVWKTVSQEPVEIREYYPYELRLNEMVRAEPAVKKQLVGQVAHPRPGTFADTPPKYLRQIVYL